MAFSSTISGRTIFGNKVVTWGTFTNGATDTGGDINTGLKICEFIVLQHKGSSVVSDAPAINETLPCNGSAVTIVTAQGEDGYWFAFGHE